MDPLAVFAQGRHNRARWRHRPRLTGMLGPLISEMHAKLTAADDAGPEIQSAGREASEPNRPAALRRPPASQTTAGPLPSRY
jgi:hypothetical protein